MKTVHRHMAQLVVSSTERFFTMLVVEGKGAAAPNCRAAIEQHTEYPGLAAVYNLFGLGKAFEVLTRLPPVGTCEAGCGLLVPTEARSQGVFGRQCFLLLIRRDVCIVNMRAFASCGSVRNLMQKPILRYLCSDRVGNAPSTNFEHSIRL